MISTSTRLWVTDNNASRSEIKNDWSCGVYELGETGAMDKTVAVAYGNTSAEAIANANLIAATHALVMALGMALGLKLGE